MNVNQIQLPPQHQLQRFSKDALQKDADFLSLKLLNRRTRLRLSPQPIPLDNLPPTTRLFAVANSKHWFAAAIRTSDDSYALSLSPLADLRTALTSTSSDGPLTLNPTATISLHPRTPHILAITRDDSRILVAFTDGSISIFDWSTPAPLFTFSSPGPNTIRGIFPSTGDSHIAAVLREPGDHPSVELLDAHNMVSIGAWNSGGPPGTKAASVSWSPKGKQIAIGLENGDVVTFSPSDTSAVKTVIPHPSSVDGQSVISLQWLSNTEFHGVYAAANSLAPDSEQAHFILSLQSKANLAGDIKLTTPYLPFPGLRPPGSFTVTLRNWEPYRFLLFVGDSTSSDVGLIGSLINNTSPADSWYNLALEEDSTPSVPLDADLNETVLVGLDLDVTGTETFRYTGVSGEATDVPAPPIMYLYASDGTLTGWHIIQTQGVPYPDMSASATPIPSPSPAATLPATQPGTFGAPQSAFETSPTATGASAFSSASLQNATAAPSSGSAFGFSAFSGAPSAFGSTSFGFGQQSQPQELKAPSPPQAPPLSAPTMSVEMISATDDSMAPETDSGFGGLSLGGGGGESKSGTTNSMFGLFGNTAQHAASSVFGGGGPTSSSTFPTFSSGPVKPAVGFGAFAGNGSSAFGSSSRFGGSAFGSGGGPFSPGGSNAGSGAFSTTQPTSAENKPASGFGQSGFVASSAKPAFEQPGFGQSSFGQSSFGKSTFGSSSFGASTASPQPAAAGTFGSGASVSGFAAFASQGTSSFGAAAQRSTDSKPVWAQNASQEKPRESTARTPSALDVRSGASAFQPSKPVEISSTPAGGAFAGLAQSNQSTTGSSVLGKTAFGQSAFGQSAFGQPTLGQSSAPSVAPTKLNSTGTFGGGGGFGSFANAGPSAFGATGSHAKDAKPAWAIAPSDTTPEKQPSSAFGFGSSVTTPSAFGSTSSTAPAASDNTTSSTSPEKPVPPVSTPPATPPVKSQGTTETTTPTSTTIPSTTPAGAGAFGSLTTSNTGFSSLQPGFGAFGGGNTTPSSSPFFQKPGAASTTPVTAFGSPTVATSAMTPQSKGASTGAAKFGTSSFGASSPTSTGFFGKLVTSATPTIPPNVAAKSAFSAFGGSPSAFGAVSGSSGKSFGEMLREKEGGQPENVKKDEGFSRTADEWKRPVSVFAQLKEAATETGKDGEDKDAEGEEECPGDTSFRSLEGGSEGDDAIDDFLKSDEEDLPSEEDEGEEEEEEAEEEGETGGSEQPAIAPTPSESPGPKSPAQKTSSVFGISFTPASPTKPEKDGESSKPAFTRAASTTPPGSPATGSAPAISRAVSAPPAGTSGLTSGLLGVGRPSTRPTRSSPLASRPISGDDEGDEEEEPPRSPLETKKARSASPAVPVSATAPSHPKTQPVLFGAAAAPPKAAPFMLSPAASPVTKSPDGSKPSDRGKGLLSGPATHGKGVFSAPVSQGGFFGQQPLGSAFPSPATPAAAPATPGAQASLVGQKPSIPTPGSIFSSPFTKSESPSLIPVASAAPPSPFALTTLLSTQSPQPAGWPQAGAASRPESPAQSMLTEFTHLYNTLTRELDDLKALAAQASFRTTQLQKPSGSAKTTDDLSELTKWVMSDLTQFRHILKEAELGLEKWEKEKAACIVQLRELEGDMLKGCTREEEVARFSKASKDAEFARMLKQRTLSPDHLETQAQLRRDVRAIRGRIQQLEEYIQASKKRLNRIKNGKPSFKPPSLDTINRTYRNIDAAINQEEDDLANLTERVAQLELSSQTTPLLSFSSSTRDRRLPDRNSQRIGQEVTPNIAASTAAALNAERSAQKLKKALLSARKQPLLNIKAVDAVPLEREDKARKALTPDTGLDPGATFAAGLNGGLPTSGSGPNTPKWSAPAGWSLPPFNLDSSTSPTAGLGGGRNRGQREKQHAKPIQLHQGVKAPPPPPPAGFSWGPVPIIQPKNTVSILAGFESIKGMANREEKGLGGSWVADDFGK